MNNAKTDTMRSTKSKAPDPPEYNKVYLLSATLINNIEN